MGQHNEEELSPRAEPIAGADAADRRESSEEDDARLLDEVLNATLGGGNRDSLELIFGVARASEYEDTSHIEAVEQVVEAIVHRKFGKRHFPKRLIHRIAEALIEVPEAAIKLEHLWQEARIRGQ